jgi:hypothetical protein
MEQIRASITAIPLVVFTLAIGLTGGADLGMKDPDPLMQPGAAASPTAVPNPLPGIEAPLGTYAEPAISPQQRALSSSAPSVLTAALAPAMGVNFAGIGMQADSDGFIHTPPDTHIAVSAERIVEVTNGHVAIYNKSGSLLAGGDSGVGAVDLDGFCAAESCFDPKVIYDVDAERFVAVALRGSTPSASWLHIMVSTSDSPNNLTSDWEKFVHDARATISGSPGWFDYPGLGASPDAIVVTGNIFDASDFFIGTRIRIFDKAELYDGDATATFSDIDLTTSAGFSPRPANHLSAPLSGTFYLLMRSNSLSLQVWALTGVPGSPALSTTTLATADQGFCLSSAPQAGTSLQISTVCPRLMNAVWRDGSLWGTLTGADSLSSRTIVQWFELSTNGYPSSLPVIQQHGAIDAGPGEFTYMPAISVDACGNAAVTYTQSSASRFPEMRYTGRLATDPLNSMQSPVVAKTSVSHYDDFSGPPERWGDYSAAVIDPSDHSFWVANEYARVAPSGTGNDGRWGTWLANFSFGCIVPTFPDVPVSHWAWAFVEALFNAGLTAGFPDGTYRPNNPVTRAEMAVFLKQGVHGGSYLPPAPDGSHPFSDIGGHWAEAWIEDLYDEGLAVGHPDGTFRPDANVTRAEIAVLMLRVMYGPGYTPPPASGGAFTDIAGHWAEDWIEQLKNEGITSGHPDGSYRPQSNGSRAEIAVFLVNTFSLPLP